MNLRCDCISCRYETQKSTEDPCYRCYNDSEYVYDGNDYNSYGEWLSLQLQKHEPEPLCPFGRSNVTWPMICSTVGTATKPELHTKNNRRRIPMPANEHFVNVVYGFANSRRAALANPSFAVCFEACIEKPSDMLGEMLVLNIKGVHIHSTKVTQIKKMINYARLLDTSVANDMCRYFVNDAFNEMELFLNNDLLARAKHTTKEDSP